MNSKILLFDIDFTIFNTSRFKMKVVEYIYHYFHLDKNALELFDREYQKQIQDTFGINIKDYSDKLGEEFSIPQDKIFNLIYNNQNLYLHSLYPDTIPTLTLLSKNYTLGIFSQGYESFQMNKLIKMGLLPYFDKKYIFVFPQKIQKEYVLHLPKNGVVIDDKLSVVDFVSKYIPAILLDREKKIIKISTPIIHSLREIPEAVNNLSLAAI